MKAGQYAVVDGEEYQATFGTGGAQIKLTVWPGQPVPPDFTGTPFWHGTLVGTLPRSRATRLVEVETWAFFHERFAVQVDRVDPDGTAAIAYRVDGGSPLGGPVRDEQGRLLTPPGMSGRPGENWMFGAARLSDLTGVQETVREVHV